MFRRKFLGLCSCSIALSGCLEGEETPDGTLDEQTLTLTVGTSTYDTGLIDRLNKAFTQQFGVEVHAIGLGTGAALETARNGDADAVIVHARPLEDAFIRDGFGVNRRALMCNDFIVVGPDDDPAGIDHADKVTEAFSTIAATETTFISRGDNSGTHHRELEIWTSAGVEPGGAWYREAGSGMGEVLTQANLTDGVYTLTDRGTYRAMGSELELGIRFQGPIEGGPVLLENTYGIIAVNPGVHEQVNYQLAMAYIGFVTSPNGQKIIEDYTVKGEPLFLPNAAQREPHFEQYIPKNWQPSRESVE